MAIYQTAQDFKDSGDEQEFLTIENVFSNMDKSDILKIIKGDSFCIHDPIRSETNLMYETGVVGMETDSISCIHLSHFSFLSHSLTITFRHGHQPLWLWAQLYRHYRYLRCLVAPVLLDLSTWPFRRKCWLRLSRPSVLTYVSALATFYLTRTTLRMSLCVMILLMCFPVRVIVSRSTGAASWMPLYVRRIMVRVTDLTWLLMMGVTWLFSSMMLRRQRTCSSRMVLSLTPYPHNMISSILCKPSSIAN